MGYSAGRAAYGGGGRIKERKAIMFTKGFNQYVCVGDSITTEEAGMTIRARVVFDEDTRPNEYDEDCYTPEQIEAWKNDAWFFCGVVLSVLVDGIEIDSHAASLWGVDCNFPGGDNSYLLTVANELLPEAIEQARGRIEALKAALEKVT